MQWKNRVLTIGPPGKFLAEFLYLQFLFDISFIYSFSQSTFIEQLLSVGETKKYGIIEMSYFTHFQLKIRWYLFSDQYNSALPEWQEIHSPLLGFPVCDTFKKPTGACPDHIKENPFDCQKKPFSTTVAPAMASL